MKFENWFKTEREREREVENKAEHTVCITFLSSLPHFIHYITRGLTICFVHVCVCVCVHMSYKVPAPQGLNL